MPALSKVVFAPQRLTASIKSAFPASVKVANVDASGRLHNKSKSSVKSRLTSDSSAVLYGTGLATVFEKGRQGGYEINPSATAGVRRSFSRTKGTTYKARAGSGDKVALKFTSGDGGFAAYAIGGPMRAYPAMGPAGRDWASGGYQSVARSKLAAAGFGSFR